MCCAPLSNKVFFKLIIIFHSSKDQFKIKPKIKKKQNDCKKVFRVFL